MKLIILSVLIGIFTISCNKSNRDENTSINKLTYNQTLNCNDINNMLVDGLPENLGNSKATINNVIIAIDFYRNMSLKNDHNKDFYIKSSSYMESKVIAFNERIIKECK